MIKKTGFHFARYERIILSILMIVLPLFQALGGEDLPSPWNREKIRQAFKPGMTATYAVKGTDWTGKPVDEKIEFTVKKSDAESIESSSGSGLVSTTWDSLKDFESPFFPMTGASATFLRKENISIPAGTFDCVVAQIHSVLDEFTVWMIANKPGLYAKIIKKDNPKGELVFQLVK